MSGGRQKEDRWTTGGHEASYSSRREKKWLIGRMFSIAVEIFSLMLKTRLSSVVMTMDKSTEYI